MELKLGNNVKELYENMAGTLRDITANGSLPFNRKIDLMWSTLRETSKKASG